MAAAALLLLGLVGLGALLGLLWLWQPGSAPASEEGPAGEAPLSLSLWSQLRRPVYEKPPLGQETELGELGRAVRLELGEAERRLQDASIRRHQINVYLSDRISLHRRLPERRHPL